MKETSTTAEQTKGEKNEARRRHQAGRYKRPYDSRRRIPGERSTVKDRNGEEKKATRARPRPGKQGKRKPVGSHRKEGTIAKARQKRKTRKCKTKQSGPGRKKDTAY